MPHIGLLALQGAHITLYKKNWDCITLVKFGVCEYVYTCLPFSSLTKNMWLDGFTNCEETRLRRT